MFHVFSEKQECSHGWKLQEGKAQISMWKSFSPLQTANKAAGSLTLLSLHRNLAVAAGLCAKI